MRVSRQRMDPGAAEDHVEDELWKYCVAANGDGDGAADAAKATSSGNTASTSDAGTTGERAINPNFKKNETKGLLSEERSPFGVSTRLALTL